MIASEAKWGGDIAPSAAIASHFRLGAVTMITEIPNFGVPDDTLIAVVLGASLAAMGGFLAARLEAWLRRRERERDASLLIGEIIFTFSMLLKMAVESRAVGDPYGQFTLRMLHAARREVDVYGRYRERLPDLRDAALRIEAHKLMLTLAIPLDGVVDASEQIASVPQTASGKARVAHLRLERDAHFDFIGGTIPKFEPLLRRLAAISGRSFEEHEAAVRA